MVNERCSICLRYPVYLDISSLERNNNVLLRLECSKDFCICLCTLSNSVCFSPRSDHISTRTIKLIFCLLSHQTSSQCFHMPVEHFRRIYRHVTNSLLSNGNSQSPFLSTPLRFPQCPIYLHNGRAKLIDFRYEDQKCFPEVAFL